MPSSWLTPGGCYSSNFTTREIPEISHPPEYKRGNLISISANAPTLSTRPPSGNRVVLVLSHLPSLTVILPGITVHWSSVLSFQMSITVLNEISPLLPGSDLRLLPHPPNSQMGLLVNSTVYLFLVSPPYQCVPWVTASGNILWVCPLETAHTHCPPRPAHLCELISHHCSSTLSYSRDSAPICQEPLPRFLTHLPAPSRYEVILVFIVHNLKAVLTSKFNRSPQSPPLLPWILIPRNAHSPIVIGFLVGLFSHSFTLWFPIETSSVRAGIWSVIFSVGSLGSRPTSGP